ncbi:MAG TPA: 1-(5-phosphoribosyl)-5-[(5-phosphoribosylamino)methylideneamino] imidazole-4-carboxamide isomerase [Gemmatimonadales bacterium]|nr:1-(5-phosphoribosyl)-5-[(5-phosphoribosylamino)methylideneamino] imidazole-4-carboxamide isomerase [Gemmatimonadales bacterium]
MDLYPAVDIRGGRVTHVRSAATTASVYGDDPAAAVRRLAAEGAQWVHLVDLDQAYGTGTNRDLVRAILAARPPQLAVQIGGSVRSEDAVRELLEWGASRVVIGCAAVAEYPDLAPRLIRRHGPARLAAAVDATAGRVRPRGRAAVVNLDMLTLGERLMNAGCVHVIYTDVRRDGLLRGPDIDGATKLAGVGLEVVASGGVSSLADLTAIRDAGLAGALVGRALHEGRFTLAEALQCVA